MRLTPKTEQQVQEEGLLPVGIYDFEVVSAEDAFSAKGNEMAVVKLRLDGQDGSDIIITDYLLEAIAYKLRHFADTTGLLSHYEKGDMPASLMKGCVGQCKIGIEPAKGEYRAKNKVTDYIGKSNGAVKDSQAPSSDPRPEPPFDDDIPFNKPLAA